MNERSSQDLHPAARSDGQSDSDLPEVRSEEGAEPQVLFLDSAGTGGGGIPPEFDPLASRTLAALYAAQGDSAKAAALYQQLGTAPGGGGGANSEGEQASEASLGSTPLGGTPGGAADLAARLAALLRELPGARAAVLVDRDGTVMAQAPEPRGGEGAAVAQACAAVPREARAAAAALSWGEPRTLSLRWPDGHLVFGFGREGSILGVEAGPGELGGRMRHAVRQALVDPEDA